MASIYVFGELLVEIMRPGVNQDLGQPGQFLGPFPSGAPAIFASAAARLGLQVKIGGAVGCDKFGQLLLRRLRQDGVNCDDVRCCEGKSTAVAFVAYQDNGEREFIYHIDGTAAVEQLFCPSEISSDAFHVMGCSLLASARMAQQILAAVTHHHRQGALISFDPNIRASLLQGRSFADLVDPILQCCTILLPGELELQLCADVGHDTTRALACLWQRYPLLQLVVLKCGEAGAVIYARDQKPLPVAAVRAEKIVDPTGAGDYFDAGFLAGYLQKMSLAQCGYLAAAAGAANVSVFGPMEAELGHYPQEALVYHKEG